jgi:adenylate cyclase
MRIRYKHDGKETVFDRETKEMVIGRHKDGVRIDLDLTPDLSVSRPHAKVWIEAEQGWIQDLGSRRGTHVGGEDIKGKGKRRIRFGEEIQIGETVLWVEMPQEAAPVAHVARSVEEGPTEIAHAIDASGPNIGPRVLPGDGASAQRLALLSELPLQFGAVLSLNSLLDVIVRRLVEVIPGAARGALLVRDPSSGELLLKAHVPVGNPAVSLTSAKRAVDQREAFIWTRGEDLSMSQKEHRSEAGMYAPLLWKNEVLGVVCVDNCESSRVRNFFPFESEDLRLLMAVAQYAAMALAHQQLEEELRRNGVLLERLLTNFSPQIRSRLLEKARQGRLRLGGDKSEVTILFSDMRGFTRISAGMDADDIVDMLNDYFSALVNAIFQHDGTVDKFVGDAILAVFGSPEPDPQQHEKAVRAALAMQAAMIEINKARTGQKEVTCDIGIGVHCGEVLHGFVGSSERMEFTVVGDAVNLASRYCAAAEPGCVPISPEVHQRVWRHVRATPLTIPTKHEGDLNAFRVTEFKSAAKG